MGQLHYYIQVKEKHIRQKVIQHMTENVEMHAEARPRIEPILNYP